jgi:GxxExxY protein
MAEHEAQVSEELTSRIIGAAMEVHRELGPGLLESVYEACLAWELKERGMGLERQVAVPVRYKGVMLDVGHRMDMVVEGTVVVEIKAEKGFDPVHTAQMLTYLKLSGCRVGLVLNFGAVTLRQGIKRVVV